MERKLLITSSSNCEQILYQGLFEEKHIFSLAAENRRQIQGWKLQQSRFRLDITTNFFTVRAVRPWNKLQEGWGLSTGGVQGEAGQALVSNDLSSNAYTQLWVFPRLLGFAGSHMELEMNFSPSGIMDQVVEGLGGSPSSKAPGTVCSPGWGF